MCIYIDTADTSGVNRRASQICHNRLIRMKLQQNLLHMISTEVSSLATHNTIYLRASSKCLCQTRTSTQFLLMCFAKHEQRTTAILLWTMRICKTEPAKKRTAHRGRGRSIGMTRNYSYIKHHRMTNSAPQAMQAEIKRSRWKARLSGQSGAKTTAIGSLLTSQSRPRLTDENIFLQSLTSSLKKIQLATHHTEACPLQ
jgi:hypothetical protein